MTSSSSPRPSLDFYRKQAKQLVRDVRAGEGRALERIRPQLRHIVSLADAQLVIAREQGFQSWASFQEGVGRETLEPAGPKSASPGSALEQLAELLAGEAFVSPRGACERLRAALQRGDGFDAAGAACALEWALGKIAGGHAVEADNRSSRSAEVDRGVTDRAMRALELLARVIRGEALDLSVICCSFCLKSNHEVAKLLGGSQGYICDVCTVAAAEILEKHAS